MGFEMIKDKLALTPQRLLSLTQLVHRLGEPRREDLLNLLQPPSVTENHDTANITYRCALRYGLIRESNDADKKVTLGVAPSTVVSAESFRQHLQRILLGVTKETDDNFLLSQFTAWYATQDERVLMFSKLDYEARFHAAMYSDRANRVLAEQPGISAWRTWAEFLGWGWPLKLRQRDEMRIVPDATLRIRPLLPEPIPEAEKDVTLGVFVQRLGQLCPELDGGVLFEQCWRAGRPKEARGNRLSLMVSTALRVLDRNGEIKLVQRADAGDSWTLFPSQSYLNAVTHIRRTAE